MHGCTHAFGCPVLPVVNFQMRDVVLRRRRVELVGRLGLAAKERSPLQEIGVAADDQHVRLAGD